jgi:hypothetical protein
MYNEDWNELSDSTENTEMPWDKFINNLVKLDIKVIDFATISEQPKRDKQPLKKVEDSILEVGQFIVPIWNLVGVKFTIHTNKITEEKVLDGLMTPLEQFSNEYENILRKRLRKLMMDKSMVNINTLAESYYFNLKNVNIVSVGQKIVLLKPKQNLSKQDYFALTICKIVSIEI